MFNNHTNNLENNRLNNLSHNENLECKTYSVKEAATILGVAQSMIYKMADRQAIPHMRFGKRLVIPKETFNSWFESKIEGGVATCAAQ